MSSTFLAALEVSHAPLLSDGAMGTMLAAAIPASVETCLDSLNVSRPDLVQRVHHAYLEAGARVIQTNSFGANHFKFAKHGLQDQLKSINFAAVELARRAVIEFLKSGRENEPIALDSKLEASDRGFFVAGDVGPLGVRLAPYGRVQPEQVRQVFAEQIGFLAESGADLIILETFSDLGEILEALAAARQVCSLPVVASLTYTRDDLTILGDTPVHAARMLYESGADLIGVNCSGGPAQIWRILRQMRLAVPQARFSAMPNAGWPEQVGGRIMYPANPEYFGDYALAFCEAGASLVGGCCGTTPPHIAAMRGALDTLPNGCAPSITELSMPGDAQPEPESAANASPLAQSLSARRVVVAVEMDPPRGLSTHKLLAGASLLAESGADVINVADSPMARMRMSPWAVCELIQHQIGVDTTLHFPTRGRSLLRVQGDLLAAHALGIRNIFVVMGDPTAIGDYPEAMDNYDLVPSGLIKLIKQNFNIGLDHAGVDIGQPTSFLVGGALNLCPPDPEREIKNLHRKIEAGVDFLLTQPVFNPGIAESFLKQFADHFGVLKTPVLVGILPLFSPRHAAFLNNEVPGILISSEILERIRRAGDRAPWEGVQIALELVEQIKPWASGVYLMPQFGRYDLAAEIVEGIRAGSKA